MYTRKVSGLMLPLALAVSQATFANTNNSNGDVYQLDDVIVTASRTAQTVDQTLAPVSVITRKDIEQSLATSVPELLSTLPGVQMSTSGGPGALASLFIRGTATSQSLVLINGQRIGSAANGQASLQYLDPDQIERIEVVRGPKSSLYGADAIGGVINIITRKGKGDTALSLSAGYGSHNTRTASTNISGSNETTHYHLGVSRFITDGYDRTLKKTGTDGDDDAYHNTTVTLTGDHDIFDHLNVGLSFYQSTGTSEYDLSGSAPRVEFKQQLISGSLKYQINDDWNSGLTLSNSKDNAKRTRSGFDSFGNTERNQATWQNDISVFDNTLLTAGVDYYKDKLDQSNNFKVKDRSNKALFVQTQTILDNNDFQISLRRDDNEAYGLKTTGGIAWGVNLPNNFRLITSYNTAFKAPNFYDLYYPYSGNYKGNTDLKPEQSKNKEIELRHSFGQQQWSMSIFQNDIKDLISSRSG